MVRLTEGKKAFPDDSSSSSGSDKENEVDEDDTSAVEFPLTPSMVELWKILDEPYELPSNVKVIEQNVYFFSECSDLLEEMAEGKGKTLKIPFDDQ